MKISHVNNLEKIAGKNDALQTRGKYNYLVDENKTSYVTLYKDGLNVDNQIFLKKGNFETREFELIFKSEYNVQLNSINDFSGESIEAIGSFKLKNK